MVDEPPATRHINHMRTALVLAITAAIGAVYPSVSQAQHCRALDEYARSGITNLRRIATSNKSGTVALRSSYGLSNIDTAAITLVADEALCARASSARDSIAGISPTGRAVYLLRMGSAYVVDPADARQSHYQPVYVFDSAWVYRGTLGRSVGMQSPGSGDQ